MRKTTEDLEDLAIFHGTPAFASPLHVGRPNQGNRRRLLARVNEMLDRNWLSNNGPFVQEFEQRITEKIDGRHCIAFANGTLALELLLEALELRGEVIVPSFTFIATVHALRRRGLVPVFCDIDPRTACLDPHRVEERISPHTSAILGVHCWGRACAVEALQEVATSHGLELLFDAAHAFGCSYRGRMVGNFGKAEVFSFHSTKFLNSFEGGAVVTADHALNARLRLMKNFGFQGYDRVVCLGTNAKMTEVSAAMGLTSLESMDEFVAINARNRRVYQEAFQDIPGLSFFGEEESEQQNHQYVVVLIEEAQTGLSRDSMLQILHAENVLARRYFYPGCHRMEPYCSSQPDVGRFLPETEWLAERVLLFPTGMQIEPQHIARISEILRVAVLNAPTLRARLSRT
jgi:dTDP-4-amino-4,6-dideoxygalactose transaminase